ncbi:thrombin inhibitor rhodniin-like [Anticarsia gemmatalis]|uniref:thrombin inhibitor rhodniin-like n=1 Tax=Anticarsia gemmatalis TaxID=129554 RepID=UPI003F7640C3
MDIIYKLGVLLLVSVQVITTAAEPCTCPQIYDPVCGTDGNAYHSKCALECAREETKQDIQVAFRASTCYSDYIAGVCGCSIEYTPICGSDRFTYPNKCHLDCIARSTTKWEIKYAYDGECKPIPNDPDCNCARVWSPVCGSDDKTYESKCILQCRAKDDPSLKFAYNAECNPQTKYYIENFKGISYPQGTS